MAKLPSTRLRLAAVALAVTALTACSTVQPLAFKAEELKDTTQQDAATIRKDVRPIEGPLSLHDAFARALKYNLERRTKLMEEALARGQFDTAKYDMLPKVIGSAGDLWRSNSKATYSSINPNTPANPTPTSENEHRIAGLEFTWSLLDYSLGYYTSKQQGDRFLVAGEKRRKAMQQLLLDTRVAYWRTLAAQKLQKTVTDTIALAEDALKDSQSAEAQRLRNPVDALRYQRQLLENTRLLESVNAELSSAVFELKQLINAPMNEPLVLDSNENPSMMLTDALLKLNTEKLEDLTLSNNADLREMQYNSRIARAEVRRVMARLYPNVSFNYGGKYDSDRYLVNNNWNEAGLQISFNLMNLFTGPGQKQLAEAGVALADQRRVAMQAAVVSQMHLGRIALDNARIQYERANQIWGVDQRIAELVTAAAEVQNKSKLDQVSNATSATLSLLRRYQALAAVQAAENRLITTLGLDLPIGSTDEMTLEEIAAVFHKPAAQIVEILK